MSGISKSAQEPYLATRTQCSGRIEDVAEKLWELSCAVFRHSVGFLARVILDGAACRLGEPGEVHDVLGALGDDRVVPIVLRVLVSW